MEVEHELAIENVQVIDSGRWLKRPQRLQLPHHVQIRTNLSPRFYWSLPEPALTQSGVGRADDFQLISKVTPTLEAVFTSNLCSKSRIDRLPIELLQFPIRSLLLNISNSPCARIGFATSFR